MRVLLIKTSSLGDVVHNLPVVADIHAHDATAIVDWVVENSFADVVSAHSGVTRVLPSAIRQWRKTIHQPATWRAWQTFRHQLQQMHYDVVIDTQGLLKSACLARQANYTKLCGYAFSCARESLASLAYTHRYVVPYAQHALIRNRQLVAQACGYTLQNQTLNYGLTLPLTQTIEAPYVLGLHATSNPKKQWDIAEWIALGQRLHQQGLRLYLPGHQPSEQAYAQRIAKTVPHAHVLPPLPLSSLMPIMRHARAVVGVDTGLTHLAVALGCITVGIYTHTKPEMTGLYGTEKCINLSGNAITVDNIWSHLERGIVCFG